MAKSEKLRLSVHPRTSYSASSQPLQGHPPLPQVLGWSPGPSRSGHRWASRTLLQLWRVKSMTCGDFIGENQIEWDRRHPRIWHDETIYQINGWNGVSILRQILYMIDSILPGDYSLPLCFPFIHLAFTAYPPCCHSMSQIDLHF